MQKVDNLNYDSEVGGPCNMNTMWGRWAIWYEYYLGLVSQYDLYEWEPSGIFTDMQSYPARK